MTRARPLTLAMISLTGLVGCVSSSHASAPVATEAPADTAAVTIATARAPAVEPTPVPVSPLPPAPVATTTEAPTATAGTAPSTPPDPPTTDSGPPSLPVWPSPADPVTLPAPDGPSAVGVAATGIADTVAYYPAVAGTGRGHPRYLDPAWATLAGLDPAQMDRVVPTAQIDATPAPTPSPRPVVLLSPGWRSVIAFSTSLAEDLASHGYVVLAMQTDLSAEWSHPRSTDGDRAARRALLTQVLDFVHGPALPSLVGPIDLGLVAVGGHSYAATVAFDAALADHRITATLDLDGSARGSATRTPPIGPTLVLVTIDNGNASDPLLGVLATRSPQIVPVGVLHAQHMDITDAPAMPKLLGTSVFATLLGPVGVTGSSDASTIVVRFLDAVRAHRLPSGAELVKGLPSTTADPFGAQTPSG